VASKAATVQIAVAREGHSRPRAHFLSVRARRGHNTVRLTRWLGRRHLRPGSYRLYAHAKGDAWSSIALRVIR
jgi:hypothetical protein